MIILISGASHTGKTVLAQRLLEQYHYPYLSLDHLKMGLIRSGQTKLTPMDDDKMTDYLWPIVREMVKTAIENEQNLIVEGCYIPFSWREDFEPHYRSKIRACWLVMTEGYIRGNLAQIRRHANDVEKRLDGSGLDLEWLIGENLRVQKGCEDHGCEMLLIDGAYPAHFLF